MSEVADICLIIEGSYPFVTGGVASWMQRLIKSYENEFTFAVVALAAGKKTEEDLRYPLPDNVTFMKGVDLFDYSEIRDAEPTKFSRAEQKEVYEQIGQLAHINFAKGKLTEEQRCLFRDILQKHKEGFFKHFLAKESGLELLTEIYDKKRSKEGFIKYYYNWRNIHLAIWRVFMLTNILPEAKLYHAPATGFSGFLACMMTELYDKPSVITEHGIYIQERDMDLSVAEWLDEEYMRDMWRDFFKGLTKFQYETVTRLITLYNGNRELAAEYGADPEKVEVIPNGIQIERFQKARRTRLIKGEVPVIGIVGRVDSVKDMKTYLNVSAIIKNAIPNIQSYVVGPTEEVESYYKECLALRELLKAEDYVTFTGPADVVEYYKIFDILLLTSVKEAMPLTVMEAMASGLPVVATRVGACEELLNGSGDDKLGIAGYVATIMDSQDIAMKTLEILNNPELANQMAQTGIERIETYYLETMLEDAYREVYKSLM